jgi:hypothetical protein
VIYQTTQFKIVQPEGNGAHQVDRKELRENKKEEQWDIRRDWKLSVHRPA